MKKYLYIGVLGSLGIFSNDSQAQTLLSGNAFINGNTVEIGQSAAQSFGTSVNTPAGYHPRPDDWSGTGPNRLGFVADPDGDGWTVGTPNFMGDYFLPGSPHEGWDIQIGTTVWNQAWGNYGSITTGFGPLLLTGANTMVETVGRNKIVHWSGSMGDLKIDKKTILDSTKTFFVIEVTLKNTGTSPIADIYYDRTVDPDNEQPLTGSFTTNNTIVYQPDPGAGDNKCLVTGIGQMYPTKSYLGLGTIDCRAKAYVQPWSLTPSDPPASIFKGTHTGGWGLPAETGEGFNNVEDCGIGLIFEVGTLLPGESTSLAYAYILKAADLDSAFAVLNASWMIDGVIQDNNVTMEICRGKEVEVNINGGGAYVWGDWEPNIGLANPSGRNNVITVQNEPITYRVIGTTTICPQNDTLYFTIIPVGDTTVINTEICAGEIYDFNGEPKFATGTYFQTYSTAVEGCDSVIRLNLKVNPKPGVDIYTPNNNICDNETALFTIRNVSTGTAYQWLRNGVAIPGATSNSYLAGAVPGEYRVVGITDKGCIDTSRAINLTVSPSASVNITEVDYGKVCIGDTITLTVDAKPGYDYFWTPEKAFRQTTGYRSATVKGIMHEDINNITVKAINQYGCQAEDQVTIVAVPCCEVMTPTAFSPNGDGLNDYFNIMLQPGQKIVTFQIFNRNGNMVYDNNSPLGWNGHHLNSGEPADKGVYFYRIIYTCTNGENYEMKGDVTLVR